MKLRTSFFNFRVLRKNLSRFAPLWILYAVGEVLGLMTLPMNGPSTARDLICLMGPVSAFHMGYAFLVAACLFGDLFDSRLCNGLHAMPLRREGWLITNLVSGLVFALIPAIVGGGVAAVILGEYGWIALVWQGVSLLQFVIFFGVAVFSAMCAGKRLAMAVIYLLINFLSVLVYWIAAQLYEPLLPGVVLSSDWFKLLCPVVTIGSHVYIDYDWVYRNNSDALVINGFLSNEWSYLWICAGVGALFLVLAWLLYRKRHLETAGDFISFRPMRYVFLVAYTLLIGMLLYGFFGLFEIENTYIFLAVGIVIGYFTGWMLLERTVKVWTGKVLLGFVAFAALFAGSMGLTALDPMGVVTYVPEAEEVKTVCLYPLNERYTYESGNGWYISDPEEIARVQALHRQVIETPENQNTPVISFTLQYELENGRRVRRSYDIPKQSPAVQDLKLFFSDVRSLFCTNDWAQVQNTVYIAHIWLKEMDEEITVNDPAALQALLSAIEADSQNGSLGLASYDSAQEYVGGMDIYWTAPGDSGTHTTYLEISGNCTNILAFLQTQSENS